jgi:hypothetical protein
MNVVQNKAKNVQNLKKFVQREMRGMEHAYAIPHLTIPMVKRV